jgi:hypothetical protein
VRREQRNHEGRTLMTKSIDELKSELETLADVVNKFQSPNVQERVAEFLLTHVIGAPLRTEQRKQEPVSEILGDQMPNAPKKKVKSRAENVTPRKSASGKLGGKRMLQKLIDDGYFSEKRSLNDIIAHTKRKLASDYSPQDFSGALGRKTRDDVLEREENAEGQYVYWKK